MHITDAHRALWELRELAEGSPLKAVSLDTIDRLFGKYGLQTQYQLLDELVAEVQDLHTGLLEATSMAVLLERVLIDRLVTGVTLLEDVPDTHPAQLPVYRIYRQLAQRRLEREPEDLVWQQLDHRIGNRIFELRRAQDE